MPDQSGNLTRQEMIDAIKAGGSVFVRGTLYTTVESVPSDADLAGDDPAKKAAAADALRAQIKASEDALAKLEGTSPHVSVVSTEPKSSTTPSLAQSTPQEDEEKAKIAQEREELAQERKELEELRAEIQRSKAAPSASAPASSPQTQAPRPVAPAPAVNARAAGPAPVAGAKTDTDGNIVNAQTKAK